MSTKMPFYSMSVAEFKERIGSYISDLPDDHEIYFGHGNLEFYRLKIRNSEGTMHQIEFNQTYDVYYCGDSSQQ